MMYLDDSVLPAPDSPNKTAVEVGGAAVGTGVSGLACTAILNATRGRGGVPDTMMDWLMLLFFMLRYALSAVGDTERNKRAIRGERHVVLPRGRFKNHRGLTNGKDVRRLGADGLVAVLLHMLLVVDGKLLEGVDGA